MKAVTLLALAATGRAFVLPESIVGHDTPIADLPGKLFSALTQTGESIFNDLSQAAQDFMHRGDGAKDDEFLFNADVGARGYDLSNLTIYEIISKSNHTKKFFEALKDHDKVVKLLNSTDANYTLFVPIDKAFEHIPDHEKPSDEYVEQALTYHVAAGAYGAGDLLTTHTIPSAYKEKYLGGEPQRLRTSISLWGLKINFYSKVVYANVKAKNGYVHAIDSILLPPTWIGRILNLIPTQFSTLVLAYETTGFGEYLHSLNTIGCTVFAPTNKAWEKLGPRANAFLFNTEKGRGYLKALLKYQIVANTTLYTDEIYYGDKDEQKSIEDAAERKEMGHFHIELPTLLGRSIGVDIHSWKGWAAMTVNGAVSVGYLDGLGKNGVVQVVDGILIPSRHPGDKAAQTSNRDVEVEDLVAALSPYMLAEEGVDNEDVSEEL